MPGEDSSEQDSRLDDCDAGIKEWLAKIEYKKTRFDRGDVERAIRTRVCKTLGGDRIEDVRGGERFLALKIFIALSCLERAHLLKKPEGVVREALARFHEILARQGMDFEKEVDGDDQEVVGDQEDVGNSESPDPENKLQREFQKWMKVKGVHVLAASPEHLFARFIASQEDKAKRIELVTKKRERAMEAAQLTFPQVSQEFPVALSEALQTLFPDSQQQAILFYAYVKAVSKRQPRVKIRVEEAHAITGFALGEGREGDEEGNVHMDAMEKVLRVSTGSPVTITREKKHGDRHFSKQRQGPVVTRYFIEFQEIQKVPPDDELAALGAGGARNDDAP